MELCQHTSIASGLGPAVSVVEGDARHVVGSKWVQFAPRLNAHVAGHQVEGSWYSIISGVVHMIRPIPSDPDGNLGGLVRVAADPVGLAFRRERLPCPAMRLAFLAFATASCANCANSSLGATCKTACCGQVMDHCHCPLCKLCKLIAWSHLQDSMWWADHTSLQIQELPVPAE